MNDDEIRTKVRSALLAIAPEVADIQLDDDKALRRQVDLDSMDWLRFITSLHQRFGIDIPEADYAGLTSIERIVIYLRERTAGISSAS